MDEQRAASSDYFFQYDSIKNAELVEADITALLVQRKRKLFYNRAYGCGIPDDESLPNTGIVVSTVGFDIVEALALRNSRVTDGQQGTDRRAFASQQTVSVEQNGSDLAVEVGYILVTELNTGRTGTVVPWGRR